MLILVATSRSPFNIFFFKFIVSSIISEPCVCVCLMKVKALQMRLTVAEMELVENKVEMEHFKYDLCTLLCISSLYSSLPVIQYLILYLGNLYT